MKLKTLIKKLQELERSGYRESRVFVLHGEERWWPMNDIKIDDVFDLDGDMCESTGDHRIMARNAILLGHE